MNAILSGWPRIATVWFGVMCWLLAYFTPFSIEAITQRFQLSEAQSSWIVTAELLMVAVTASVLGQRISAVSKRKLMTAGLLITLVGLSLSLFSPTIGLLVAAKLISGFGFGIILASSYSIPAHFAEPEKLFAHVAITISVVFTFSLFLLPNVMASIGPRAVEVWEMGMIGIGLAIVKVLPEARAVRPRAIGAEVADRTLGSKAYLALFGVFGLFVTQAICLGFSIVATKSIGANMANLELAFAAAALIQLPTGIVLALVGTRFGYLKPILLGCVILIAASFAIFNSGSSMAIYVGVATLSAGATIMNPYQMAVLSDMDKTGRVAVFGGALTNFGTALGPAFAGVILISLGQAAIGLTSAGILVLVALATSMALAR